MTAAAAQVDPDWPWGPPEDWPEAGEPDPEADAPEGPSVYLLHFLEKIGNPTNPRAMAQHYIGWTADLPERIASHTANLRPQPGTGRVARIVAHVQRQGIGFVVARTWPGDYRLERQLKRRRNAPKLCPVCRAAR